MKPLILVKGLHHTYQDGTPQAKDSLLGVDLQVEKGEIVALTGSTGSGKSTLLQHLNGLLTPRKGEVWIDGKELKDPDTDLRQIRRAVGLVFQRPEDQLFEQYVGDDIAYGPRLAGLKGKELAERVRWAMELVGLGFEEYKDRPVFALSGGERRKAGFAGVLALQPQVLLLDEPTSGLDPSSREGLIGLLKRLNQEGMTLLMATHSMETVARLAARVYVLKRGRIALSGTAGEVLGNISGMRQLGLDAPSTVLLMDALRKRGWDVPLEVMTEEAAETVIRNTVAFRSRNADRSSGEKN
ncbi:MAG TPA: ATP-binding cassette domain-containing protein [Spirochaetia bacterium]|nr:ATP-binding cassette domain-containing protein [Spirochaetia bacterium]